MKHTLEDGTTHTNVRSDLSTIQLFIAVVGASVWLGICSVYIMGLPSDHNICEYETGAEVYEHMWEPNWDDVSIKADQRVEDYLDRVRI